MKLNEIDLNKLNVFIVVGQQQGITSAAKKLCLSPSAVSQSIKNLEASLCTNLFDRVGKQLLLTVKGQMLWDDVSTYQNHLATAINRMHRNKVGIHGRLRLGVFYGFSNTILAKLISQFHGDYPGVEIEVIFASPSKLDRHLKYGHMDFTINLQMGEAPPDIYVTNLLKDELWLVSARSPLPRELAYDELRAAPFIDYYRSCRLVPTWVEHHFGKCLREYPVAAYASNSELVVQLILQGMGVGVVASSIAHKHVYSGDLFVIRGKSQQLHSQVELRERLEDIRQPLQLIFRDWSQSFFKSRSSDRLRAK